MMTAASDDPRRAKVCVLAPSPIVTVTIEPGAGDDEVHFHAGGQGFWVARMIAELGASVTLCSSFGGEAGRIARALVSADDIDVRDVATAGTNGAYVHDRRSGERRQLASMGAAHLSRHEVDELYGAVLVAALDCDVCVLGSGPLESPVVPADIYGRLAADLADSGVPVVADLSGPHLTSVLEGGVAVLKASHAELLATGITASDDLGALLAAVRDLASRARHVVVSRADQPSLAVVDDEIVEVAAPIWKAVDHRGGGDSLTAGLAVALAQGRDFRSALCLGAAAGALNVTRRGLGSGRVVDIEALSRHVELRHLVHTPDRCPHAPRVGRRSSG